MVNVWVSVISPEIGAGLQQTFFSFSFLMKSNISHVDWSKNCNNQAQK